jgi:hypothetical protein
MTKRAANAALSSRKGSLTGVPLGCRPIICLTWFVIPSSRQVQKARDCDRHVIFPTYAASNSPRNARSYASPNIRG